MLDLKVIKENTQHVKERLAARGKDYSQDIDKVLELDTMRRSLIAETEQLKAKQNAITKQVPIMKKEGKNTDELFAAAFEAAKKRGLLRNGDLVVTTAGVPLGISGNTNLLRVDTIGNPM